MMHTVSPSRGHSAKAKVKMHREGESEGMEVLEEVSLSASRSWLGTVRKGRDTSHNWCEESQQLWYSHSPARMSTTSHMRSK